MNNKFKKRNKIYYILLLTKSQAEVKSRAVNNQSNVICCNWDKRLSRISNRLSQNTSTLNMHIYVV